MKNHQETHTKSLTNQLIVGADTNQRKNMSLWMMFGGAVIFTIFAAISLYLVRNEPHWVFWLGVAAHVQIFSIMAGYIAQLVKRRVLISRQGLGIEDLEHGGPGGGRGRGDPFKDLVSADNGCDDDDYDEYDAADLRGPRRGRGRWG